jgi:glyoxylase-like metal-dependent hydrolase (beta-lactamase superfamily II)
MPDFAQLSSIQIGKIKVTYLPDGGGVVVPGALYPASTADGWQKYPDLLNEEGQFLTTIGAFLIEVGDEKIAVDTGIGPVNIEFPGFGPFFGGRYLDSLAGTGVKPEAVTQVVFTHLHLDHCGWTTVEKDGERALTFPNASHWATQAEWDFWHGGDNPAGPHPEFVQRPLAGRLQFLAEGEEIAPGVTVVSTPGHTPGHISLRLESEGKVGYLLGDVLHGAMQLAETDWSVAFDIDQAAARATRDNLLPQVEGEGVIVAANHFSNAVFGHIVMGEDGRRHWQPLA